MLVETDSAEQVRRAIWNLSGVWGGVYMPILDVRATPKTFSHLAQIYDVDALWADTDAEPTGELLGRTGLAWRGVGPYGPFGRTGGFVNGLLPASSLMLQKSELLLPMWESDAQDDLILSAVWGPPDVLTSASGFSEVRTVPVAEIDYARAPGQRLGSLAAGAMHVSREPRNYLDSHRGLYVVRRDHPQDVVEFWNARSLGMRIGAVPADGGERLPHLLAHSWWTERAAESLEGYEREPITVWGADRAAPEVIKAVELEASKRGLDVRTAEPGVSPHFAFEGLRTSLTRPIREDFRPEARTVDIEVPPVPLGVADSLFPGVVAAQIELHSVRGQDPRLTSSIPPYPRHAELIANQALASDARQVRVSTSGPVIGIQAHATSLSVPFASNLEVMRLLFDDPSVQTDQSDDGKFQSRAGERFGGPFGGFLNQPGVRAALAGAAASKAGLPMQQIEGVIDRNRGTWPHSVWGPGDPKTYVRRQLNHLLHTGIFIPTARVHCGHCRVESYVSADDLASTMSCEFCGESLSLALSHGLAKPLWRYRLASHLVPARVEALLPALATASLIAQFRHVEEPPLPHVLGLLVRLGQREVEVDVAAYLPDREWTVVLCEVKTANRIDENDAANLELLQTALGKAGVRCTIAFVTLKDAFSADEVRTLRGVAERSKSVMTAFGGVVPNLPLVLTGPDVSHHPMSEEHPWRWSANRSSGLPGAALASCGRNLGLEECSLAPDGAGTVVIRWRDERE